MTLTIGNSAIKQILALRRAGWSQNMIAFAAGLSPSTICKIMNRSRNAGFESRSKINTLWAKYQSGEINIEVVMRIRDA